MTQPGTRLTKRVAKAVKFHATLVKALRFQLNDSEWLWKQAIPLQRKWFSSIRMMRRVEKLQAHADEALALLRSIEEGR